MNKMKNYFIRKEEYSAYDGLTLMWPCVENMTQHLVSQLNDSISKGTIADAIQDAVKAYHQQSEYVLNDWERLAIYFIELSNFVSRELGGNIKPLEVAESCKLPSRLNRNFINAVAEKMSLRIGDA